MKQNSDFSHISFIEGLVQNGMAKCGVKVKIEIFVIFSRDCFSTSHFFRNLVSWKKHSLRFDEIELSVKFSPPFANTFSVICHFNKKTVKN